MTLFLAPFNPDFHRSIQDNIFADVTFESFDSNFSVDQIRYFYCDSCYLNFDPPNNIQNVLNQMKNLNTLEISLNVTEIPSRFIQPINDQSNLTRLQISSLHNNLTIKSEAIQNLNQLKYMTIVKTTIKRVEKDAFKIINNSNELSIIFEQCNLTGNLNSN